MNSHLEVINFYVKFEATYCVSFLFPCTKRPMPLLGHFPQGATCADFWENFGGTKKNPLNPLPFQARKMCMRGWGLETLCFITLCSSLLTKIISPTSDFTDFCDLGGVKSGKHGIK